MHKVLKDVIDTFLKSADEVDPLSYCSDEDIKLAKYNLDIIQTQVEKRIFDYGIELTEDIIDTDNKMIIRMFILSKGTTEHFIMIASDGQILMMDDEMPNILLGAICNLISDIVSS